MRKLIVTIFMFLSLLSFSQVKITILQMKNKATPFLLPYYKDQRVESLDTNISMRLTHDVTATQTLNTVYANNWYQVIGTSTGGSSPWATIGDTTAPVDPAKKVLIRNHFDYVGQAIYNPYSAVNERGTIHIDSYGSVSFGIKRDSLQIWDHFGLTTKFEVQSQNGYMSDIGCRVSSPVGDFAPCYWMAKSAGSLDHPLDVSNGDRIGGLIAAPYKATPGHRGIYRTAAKLLWYVNGTVSNDTVPLDMIYYNHGAEWHSDGGIERWRIKDNGDMILQKRMFINTIPIKSGTADSALRPDYSNGGVLSMQKLAAPAESYWLRSTLGLANIFPTTTGDILRLPYPSKIHFGNIYPVTGGIDLYWNGASRLVIDKSLQVDSIVVSKITKTGFTRDSVIDYDGVTKQFIQYPIPSSGGGTPIDSIPFERNATRGVTFLRNSGDNVGIGTASPTAKLQVAGRTFTLQGNGDGTGLQIVNGEGTTGTVYITNPVYYGANYGGYEFKVGSTIGGTYTALAIHSGGNVLYKTDNWIGDSYPLTFGQRYMDGAQMGVHVYNDSRNSADMMLLTRRATGVNDFEETMRLDRYGNVGIGTTTPTSRLHVVGLEEYTDNAAALTAGLTVGAFYRTGDLLKVVH